MSGKIVSFLAVLAMAAGVAMAAPQQGGMNGQMGGGQMGGGQMGGQMGGRRHGLKHRMNIDRRVARMKSDLNLTDKQAGQVKDLFEKQEKKRQSWRESNARPTRAERHEHRRQMMAEMNTGMKKILTVEQFKKWKTMRRKRMRNRRWHRKQAPPQN